MADRTDGLLRTSTEPTTRRTDTRRGVLKLVGAALAGVGLAAGSSGGGAAASGGSSNGGDALGGGAGYDAITRDQADTVASGRTELADALGSASSGDVVFVPGSASIDLGSSGLDVPGGVTLASNRGTDGSEGALLSTGSEPNDLLRLQEGSRLSGVRLRGPNTGGQGGSSSRASGATVLGSDVEIDNALVRGFSYAGVYVNGGSGHFHHNEIRENNKGGLGYGISMVSGRPLIEYNYFNYNRHSVATGGSHFGYACRYNHFGPDLTSHVIDAHEPANTRIEIKGNVVEGYVDTGGGQRPAVAIRGVPDDRAAIRDNWFWNPDPPLDSPSHSWTEEAIIQPETASSWSNVEFSGNNYGEDASVSFSDVIAGYDGSKAEPDRA